MTKKERLDEVGAIVDRFMHKHKKAMDILSKQ